MRPAVHRMWPLYGQRSTSPMLEAHRTPTALLWPPSQTTPVVFTTASDQRPPVPTSSVQLHSVHRELPLLSRCHRVGRISIVLHHFAIANIRSGDFHDDEGGSGNIFPGSTLYTASNGVVQTVTKTSNDAASETTATTSSGVLTAQETTSAVQTTRSGSSSGAGSTSQSSASSAAVQTEVPGMVLQHMVARVGQQRCWFWGSSWWFGAVYWWRILFGELERDLAVKDLPASSALIFRTNLSCAMMCFRHFALTSPCRSPLRPRPNLASILIKQERSRCKSQTYKAQQTHRPRHTQSMEHCRRE